MKRLRQVDEPDDLRENVNDTRSIHRRRIHEFGPEQAAANHSSSSSLEQGSIIVPNPSISGNANLTIGHSFHNHTVVQIVLTPGLLTERQQLLIRTLPTNDGSEATTVSIVEIPRSHPGQEESFFAPDADGAMRDFLLNFVNHNMSLDELLSWPGFIGEDLCSSSYTIALASLNKRYRLWSRTSPRINIQSSSNQNMTSEFNGMWQILNIQSRTSMARYSRLIAEDCHRAYASLRMLDAMVDRSLFLGRNSARYRSVLTLHFLDSEPGSRRSRLFIYKDDYARFILEVLVYQMLDQLDEIKSLFLSEFRHKQAGDSIEAFASVELESFLRKTFSVIRNTNINVFIAIGLSRHHDGLQYLVGLFDDLAESATQRGINVKICIASEIVDDRDLSFDPELTSSQPHSRRRRLRNQDEALDTHSLPMTSRYQGGVLGSGSIS